MKTTTMFREAVAQIPNDVRTEDDLSFAIADKIDAILKQKGITQKEFAKNGQNRGRSVTLGRWPLITLLSVLSLRFQMFLANGF